MSAKHMKPAEANIARLVNILCIVFSSIGRKLAFPRVYIALDLNCFAADVTRVLSLRQGYDCDLVQGRLKTGKQPATVFSKIAAPTGG